MQYGNFTLIASVCLKNRLKNITPLKYCNRDKLSYNMHSWGGYNYVLDFHESNKFRTAYTIANNKDKKMYVLLLINDWTLFHKYT